MMRRTSLLSAFLLIGTSLSLQGCVPAIIVGASGGLVAANSASSNLSLGTQVEDSTIKAKSVAMLAKFPELNEHSNVEVVVFNRIVLLLGQVPSKSLSQKIADKISSIERVRIVYNQLTAGTAVSPSQYAKDTWITTKVKTEMLGKINPGQFKVVTEDGIVYLLGLTTKTDGRIASEVASHVSGVKQVIEAYSIVKSEQPAEIKSDTRTRSRL